MSAARVSTAVYVWIASLKRRAVVHKLHTVEEVRRVPLKAANAHLQHTVPSKLLQGHAQVRSITTHTRGAKAPAAQFSPKTWLGLHDSAEAPKAGDVGGSEEEDLHCCSEEDSVHRYDCQQLYRFLRIKSALCHGNGKMERSISIRYM